MHISKKILAVAAGSALALHHGFVWWRRRGRKHRW